MGFDGAQTRGQCGYTGIDSDRAEVGRGGRVVELDGAGGRGGGGAALCDFDGAGQREIRTRGRRVTRRCEHIPSPTPCRTNPSIHINSHQHLRGLQGIIWGCSLC